MRRYSIWAAFLNDAADVIYYPVPHGHQLNDWCSSMLAFENDTRVKFIDSGNGNILPGITEARALCLQRSRAGKVGALTHLYREWDSKAPCDSKSAVAKWAPRTKGGEARRGAADKGADHRSAPAPPVPPASDPAVAWDAESAAREWGEHKVACPDSKYPILDKSHHGSEHGDVCRDRMPVRGRVHVRAPSRLARRARARARPREARAARLTICNGVAFPCPCCALQGWSDFVCPSTCQSPGGKFQKPYCVAKGENPRAPQGTCRFTL